MAGLTDVLHHQSSMKPFLALLIVLGLAFVAHLHISKSKEGSLKHFPKVALPGLTAKESWAKHAREVLSKGTSTHKDQPFQVVAGTGPKLIVPNKFAEELKDHPQLTRNGAITKDWFIEYPGFEAFRSTNSPELIKNVVQQKITPSLARTTEDLVDEATAGIHDLYGEAPEWHSVNVKVNNSQLIARMSSRVFLGKPLCRNEEWIDISTTYTQNAFHAMRTMRNQVPFMRRFAHWYAKSNKSLIKQVKAARRLLDEEVNKRIARAQKALEAGEKPPKVSDAVGWMVEAHGGWEEVDHVAAQLTLATVSINTTVEAITSCLLDLCLHPELIPLLRQEMIDVLGQESWTRRALFRMKLTDAFLKESQRVHPPLMASLYRYATDDIVLSDGTVIPKGARLLLANRFDDPTLHPNPEKFDIDRFLNTKNGAYVTTSSDFMAFGWGNEGICPGRFLANNELKIVLCHILLKYDIARDEEKPPVWLQFEEATVVDPRATILMRRRKEEIKVDLDYEVD